jgi:hypothetical protein
MEQLKVRKKDTLIINVIIFLILSFFFLYLQHAYRHQLSPFSILYLRKGIELFWYVAVTLIFAGAFIWRHHKISVLAYQISVTLVGFKVLEGLFIEFNKVIVIALFFYIVISYFIYQLMKQYFELSYLNPNYGSRDLFKPLLRDIPSEVTSGIEVFQGTLTNWDSEGCFIKFSGATPIEGNVRVQVTFRGRQFIQKGEVVASTLDSSGFGIRFDKTVKDLNIFNWSEFVEIVQELGFLPERLR